jgi:ribonucleoside-diphosphate reductase alpha chain
MDSMLTDFIDKNKDSFLMQNAVRFAERHRAMGMGASGYHNYLQATIYLLKVWTQNSGIPRFSVP